MACNPSGDNLTSVFLVDSGGEVEQAKLKDNHDDPLEKISDEFRELDELGEHYEQELELYDKRTKLRNLNFELPRTVTVLSPPDELVEKDIDVKPDEAKLYLVGTAHFSQESQNDVRKIIRETQPDAVMVELDHSRTAILTLDEATILNHAKELNFHKMNETIKEFGLLQGLMNIMLLSMSASLTKQLGMAPGGEFRAAFSEARKVPGCEIHLGDREIGITLQRAWRGLSAWKKLRLVFALAWSSREKISQEDVEKCKQHDMLEELLSQLQGEYPELTRTFVSERDMYMACMLRSLVVHCAQVSKDLKSDGVEERKPAVVVGVVGMGHLKGISSQWNNVHQNVGQLIREILDMPDGGQVGLDWVWSSSSDDDASDGQHNPLVLVLPGLTGSSQESYVLHLVETSRRLGYNTVVFNNRGNGNVPLLTSQTYSAAYTDDLGFVIRHVRKRITPPTPILAVGFSLGGFYQPTESYQSRGCYIMYRPGFLPGQIAHFCMMILFNYISKHGPPADAGIDAAMVVSSAWNPFESSKILESFPYAQVFNKRLASNLVDGIKRNRRKFDDILDVEYVLQSKLISDFDDRFIVPMFGYDSLADYYNDASIWNKVDHVQIPTICLNAINDCFSPLSAIPLETISQSDHVALVLTANGGHLGFLTNDDWWPSGPGFIERLFGQFAQAFFGDYVSSTQF